MSGIVVLGSLHLNMMVRSPHLPKPGQSIQGERLWRQSGGKGGDQAVAAAKANAAVTMIGRVGKDDSAAILKAGLREHNIETTHVATDPEIDSGICVTTLDANGNFTAVVVSGANQKIDRRQIDGARDLIESADLLLLQNEINQDANIEAAQIAKAASVPVLLNAAPARDLPQELSKNLDILIVNALEAEALGTVPVRDLAMAERAAIRLAKRVPNVVVTAGKHGVAWSKDKRSRSEPALPVEQQDCSDVFIGRFAADIAAGASFEEAIATGSGVVARATSRA